jgi:CMP-N,N'-diacetyllegionaminic acid synthase
MTFLAITLARAGSKRLKNKNLLKISNSNLIEITFSQSIKSKFFKDIYLSTESKKIASVGKKIGYKVPFIRPQYLAKDNSRSETVILNFLKKIKKKFKYVILLQPTSPLRNFNHIDYAIKKFLKEKYESLISIGCSVKKHKLAVEFHKNFLRKGKKKINGKYYFINGAIYISKIDKFLKNKSFFSRKTGFYLMPNKYSLDIDTKKDLKLFKKVIKNNR